MQKIQQLSKITRFLLLLLGLTLVVLGIISMLDHLFLEGGLSILVGLGPFVLGYRGIEYEVFTAYRAFDESFFGGDVFMDMDYAAPFIGMGFDL